MNNVRSGERKHGEVMAVEPTDLIFFSLPLHLLHVLKEESFRVHSTLGFGVSCHFCHGFCFWCFIIECRDAQYETDTVVIHFIWFCSLYNPLE